MARYVGSIAIMWELLLCRRALVGDGSAKVWSDANRSHEWCGLFDLERNALDHYDSVLGARKAAAVRRPIERSTGVPPSGQVRTINVTCSRTATPRIARAQWRTMTVSAKATRAVPALDRKSTRLNS